MHRTSCILNFCDVVSIELISQLGENQETIVSFPYKLRQSSLDKLLPQSPLSPVISARTKSIFERVEAASISHNDFYFINLRNQLHHSMAVPTNPQVLHNS